MLVDHLALELNGERCGKDFCKENEKEIINDVEKNMDNNEEYRKMNIGSRIIKDKNEIKSIMITKKIGEKAKNSFLKKVDDEGFNYLKEIIKDYKIAIESLPKLCGDLKENPTL